MAILIEKFHTTFYDNEKVYIESAREKNKSWDEIKLCSKNTVEERDAMLIRKKEEDYWNVDPEDWELFVDLIKNIKEEQMPSFIAEPTKPDISLKLLKGGCWNKYKEKLSNPKSGFSIASVEAIKKSSQRIVSYLEKQTDINNPVRGMVVGNVQSGKTANMAGVISMAADIGFNFFIVLSGTIDNLRLQTQERLYKDLNNGSSLHFRSLNNLSSKSPFHETLKELNLINSNERYLTVCLKNSTRLKDLLNWLNMDECAKANLKILVIDDEADQAGINTKDIDSKEQTAISRLIKNLVFARNSKNEICFGYGAMNYIGYTATPYANFLNESGADTLYPKNFICLLSTPFEYFGPQEIFGVEEVNDNLNIINEIKTEEAAILRRGIYTLNEFPNSLKDAIGWFIISVSIARFYNLETPISMLIHTSQMVSKHSNIERFIKEYFGSIEINDYLIYLEDLYNVEKKMITISDLCENIPEYNSVEINDYPAFTELMPYIFNILSTGLTNILFDDESGKHYSDRGIHLCVDNCATSSTNEVVMRIVYPDKNDEIRKKCPAFIVIGGSTLSRGLTLEGLTTSYFLRSSKQADTLMQMGRWFGYRQKYELFQRIWLSKPTFEQFAKLSYLDYKLRSELNTMEIKNLSPEKYGPHIKTFPDYKLLILTSKKKMQSTITVDQSFYDKSGQTTKFYRDNRIIEENFKNTINFLNDLGTVNRAKIASLDNDVIKERKHPLVWFDVDYKKTIDFIFSLKLPKNKATFDDYDNFIKWYEKDFQNDKLDNFTVVVSNSAPNEDKCITLESGEKVYLENRSRLEKNGVNKENYDQIINIKTLTVPGDTFMDIDASNLSLEDKDILFSLLRKNKSVEHVKHSQKRYRYASKKSPLLILYIIDKDGEKVKTYTKNDLTYTRKSMKDLNLPNHLVGYYIYIPIGDESKPNTYVTIKLNYEDDEDYEYED